MISPETFKTFEIFADKDQDFIEQLCAISEEMVLSPETWVFHEGDHADAMYLIIDGSIDLRLVLDKNKHTYASLNTITQGETFGWSAVIEPYVYRLGAVVKEKTTAIKISGKQLRDLIDKDPEHNFAMMEAIANAMSSRLSNIQSQIPQFTARSVANTVLLAAAGTTLLLNIVLGLVAVAGGNMDSVFPVFMFCFAVPIVFFVLATVVYPKNQYVG